MKNKKKHPRAAELLPLMEDAWLAQLQREHETIAYLCGLDLALPLFRISASRTRLGEWDGERRILTISAELISTASWNTVLQVLKHEMAHQICTELFRAPDEGHGRLFQLACDQLGLSGPFRHARADCAGENDIREEGASTAAGHGRIILAKVEKLLALAGSDNEHEAALAMQRAGELLRRHNLSLLDAGETEYRHVVLSTGLQRMPGHLQAIGSLLQEYFFVKVVFSSEYDPFRDVRLRTICLMGRPENTGVAEHCYHFLLNRLDTLWQANRKRFKGSGIRARNSYMQGVIAGFRQKLAAEERRAPRATFCRATETTSLAVVREDRGLEEFIVQCYPRLSRGRRRTITVHSQAWNDAVGEGRKLVLYRVVEEKMTGAGGLLDG